MKIFGRVDGRDARPLNTRKGQKPVVGRTIEVKRHNSNDRFFKALVKAVTLGIVDLESKQ